MRGRKEISRQEMDLEKSMFMGIEKDSNALTSLLAMKTPNPVGHSHDPINHLPQLLIDIEGRSKKSCHAKKILAEHGCVKCPSVHVCANAADGDDNVRTMIGCLTNDEGVDIQKKCDLEMTAVIGCLTYDKMMHREGNPVNESGTGIGCSKCEKNMRDQNQNDSKSKELIGCLTRGENLVTVQGESETKTDIYEKFNSVDVLGGHIEFFTREYIEKNQLSVQEIKELPKFCNYCTGIPNNVGNILFFYCKQIFIFTVAFQFEQWTILFMIILDAALILKNTQH